MKCISEVGLRFLIGIGIAALIGFLFWYFVIHNASDRVVEKNFQKFYDALDRACQRVAAKDNPERVYIEIPQKTFASILEEFNEFVSRILGGSVSKTFQDPYYTFHWELFPPEPPYDLLDVTRLGIVGLPGTLAAIFIPWREDLPWSTNLLTSMAIYSVFFGFDVLGIKEAKNAVSKGFRAFKNELAEIGRKIANKLKDSETLQKIAEFLEKGEAVIEKVSEKIGKIKVTLKKIREGKAVKIMAQTFKPIELSRTSAQLTILCLFVTDNTLEKCLEYGIIGGITLRASYAIAREVAFPVLKSKIKSFIAKITGNLKSFASNVKEEVKDKLISLKTLIFGKEDLLEKLSNDLEKAEEYLDEIEEILKKEKIDYDKLKYNVNELKEFFSSLPKKIEEIGEKNPDVYEEVYSSVYVKSKLMEERLEELLESLKEKDKITLHAKGVIPISEFNGVLDRLPEELVDKPNEKALMSQGFKLDNNNKLVLTREGNKELFNNFKSYVDYYKETTFGRKLDRIGDYRLIYDEKGNLYKVVYDPQESLGKTFREIFINPIKNFFKKLEEKAFVWNELIDAESIKNFANELVDEIQRKSDADFVRNLEKALGMSANEIVEKLQNLASKMDESIGVVMEKGTKLAEMIKNLPDKTPQEVSHILREYAYYIATRGNPIEIELFKNLLNGKEFRIREDLVTLLRSGAIGYAILRVADIYTPLGVTWWDIYLSYYGYEGQRVPEGCQTQCERGKICVQLGACFRQYELPESCKKLKIENIKIERDSIIAKNPRFYLVSPCYGEAHIYIDPNERTIFVKVLLDPNKKPNYCYAYKNYVDAYVLLEATEIIAKCACGIACAAVEVAATGGAAAALGVMEAVAACLGGPPAGLCRVLCDFLGVSMLAIKEGLMVWPNIYENFPNYAEWMQ
jgi:methyl-accepting chemotaxis protein